uniref:Uncharacterized protein n=1 Tax=Malurus cyaneus samueli TaxID=2593467 RepID=A0A8C5UDT5_9PASS
MQKYIILLKQQLKEAENERRKAAQYGLHLLESQSEVQNQLDQTRRELTEKTEINFNKPLSSCREGSFLYFKTLSIIVSN